MPPNLTLKSELSYSPINENVLTLMVKLLRSILCSKYKNTYAESKERTHVSKKYQNQIFDVLILVHIQ